MSKSLRNVGIFVTGSFVALMIAHEWDIAHPKTPTPGPTSIARQPEQGPSEPNIVWDFSTTDIWESQGPNDPNVSAYGFLVNVTCAPCTSIMIGGVNAVTIEWGSGEVVVTGANEEGAKIFFEHMLKPMIEEYIRHELD